MRGFSGAHNTSLGVPGCPGCPECQGSLGGEVQSGSGKSACSTGYAQVYLSIIVKVILETSIEPTDIMNADIVQEIHRGRDGSVTPTARTSPVLRRELHRFPPMLSQCSPSISIFSGLGNLKHDAVITLAHPETSVRGHYNIPFVFIGIDSYGYMMYLI